MKPSEPSSPRETDIRLAEADVTTNPDHTPAADPCWTERPLPSFVLPDPGRRFSFIEGFIVLGCCVGCVWLGLNAGQLVIYHGSRDGPSGSPYVGGARMSPEEMAYNFLLGLGPACPLVLLYQYALKRRRSWPKLNEWPWLWAALATLTIFEEALPRDFRRAADKIIPNAVESFLFHFLFFGPCFLAPVWLMIVIIESPGWFSRATWTDWLAILSFPLLLYVLLAWAGSRLPQWS